MDSYQTCGEWESGQLPDLWRVDSYQTCRGVGEWIVNRLVEELESG